MNLKYALSKQEIRKILEKKDMIEIMSHIKTAEKNTRYLALFNDYFLRLFQWFGADINQHLSYINTTFNINIPNAKYLHYIKNNFIELYEKYIIVGDKLEVVNDDNFDESLENLSKIHTKSIANYDSGIDLEKEMLETESLLSLLDVKKTSQKELRNRQIFNFINTIVVSVILLFTITIV